MKKCPNCGEIIFSINSSSDEFECLNKDCGYSTISKTGIELFFIDEEKAAKKREPEKADKISIKKPESKSHIREGLFA